MAAAISKQIGLLARQITVYSMQAAALANEDLLGIELVGPKGYTHGWIRSAGVSREGGDPLLAAIQAKRAERAAAAKKDKKSQQIAAELRSARVAREGGDRVLAAIHERRARDLSMANPLEMTGPKGYSHGWVRGSAAAAMVGKRMSRREAAGVVNLFAPKGSGKGVRVSRQAARNQSITGVPTISGPFGKHLSKSEAEGFAQMFGGNKRKQKVYAELKKGGSQHGKAQKVLAKARSKQVQMATELSAKTGVLSVTPAPRGKPGGPGLYGIKGEGHTPYLQQIVKALIEKRGMPESKAYAIARAAIRRWARGGGHVHPEVRAAAGKSEAGELEKQARAKAA